MDCYNSKAPQGQARHPVARPPGSNRLGSQLRHLTAFSGAPRTAISALAQLEVFKIGFELRGGAFEKFFANFTGRADGRHRVMAMELVGVNPGGHHVRMARGIKGRGDSHLLEMETELVGDDLRQRGSMALARIETAGKDRRRAIGFHPHSRRFALPAQKL